MSQPADDSWLILYVKWFYYDRMDSGERPAEDIY